MKALDVYVNLFQYNIFYCANIWRLAENICPLEDRKKIWKFFSLHKRGCVVMDIQERIHLNILTDILCRIICVFAYFYFKYLDNAHP